MKGMHRIIVQNKKIKYDFIVKRNITIIRGDSATGKTALVDMIGEHYENGEDSGITLQCDKTCVVLEGVNWEILLRAIHDSIVFIDEGARFVATKEFSRAIQETDNYYVIVTREGLAALPYSVEEIYGIRNSGKYGQLKQTYNELFHIYGRDSFGDGMIKPEAVITEDSNAGYAFFEHVCRRSNIPCKSANGKSNIFPYLTEQDHGRLLVIADGAAFGSEMEKIMLLMKTKENITLYLPESFEWLILKSGLIHNKETEKILGAPYDHIESREYFSWERYFTELLTKTTANSYLQYSKRTLNDAYVQETAAEKILQVMKPIELN